MRGWRRLAACGLGLVPAPVQPEPSRDSRLYTAAAITDASLADQEVPDARRVEVEAKPQPPVGPLAAAVASGHVGQYVHSEMELVAGLWLKADGTFEYGLTVGALDETARGRWTADGDRIALVNVPPPVPPTITAGAAVREAAARLSVKVVTPAGDGVPGVDLVIGFDQGEPVGGYTQSTGWSLADDEARTPRWITLSMAPYGLASPRFPIDVAAANALTFVLTPNDIGVVDLSKARVVADRDGLTIDRDGRTMHFDKRDGR